MKKGQITVFIIIAVLMLIGVSVYIYLQQQEVAVAAEYLAPLIKEAPVAAIPVVNYVQSCLKDHRVVIAVWSFVPRSIRCRQAERSGPYRLSCPVAHRRRKSVRWQ